MLSDRQSLILTGFMVAGIFIFGILDLLQNFVVLTVLTILFFTIIINILYSKSKNRNKIKE